jgi:hypothetical protein
MPHTAPRSFPAAAPQDGTGPHSASVSRVHTVSGQLCAAACSSPLWAAHLPHLALALDPRARAVPGPPGSTAAVAVLSVAVTVVAVAAVTIHRPHASLAAAHGQLLIEDVTAGQESKSSR